MTAVKQPQPPSVPRVLSICFSRAKRGDRTSPPASPTPADEPPAPSTPADEGGHSGGSSTPEITPEKKSIQLLKLEEEVAHKQAMASSIAVYSIFLQGHPEWTPESLKRKVSEAEAAGTTSHAEPAEEFNVKAVKVVQERPQQTSLRFFGRKEDRDQLYDG